MIHEVMDLFKNRLNAYIKLKTDVQEDKVNFLDGTQMDPIQFPLNSITPIVVNIQEERIMRKGDYYQPVTRNGLETELAPEIRIKLIVLFVSRFSDYSQGLNFLSMIIRFFQANRLINRDVAPELPEAIDRLFVEMLSMPMSEQDDIWNALRTHYFPSVAFSVKMLTYKDGESLAELNKLEEFNLNLNQL